MLPRLGCLFVLVPLVELALLVQVGRWMGLLPTLALVAGTGVVGAFLARREGTRALGAIRREVQAGRMPGGPLVAAAAVLVGAAFLLTPGVLTDLVGLFLLIPPTREWIVQRFVDGLRRRIREGKIQVTGWTWSGSAGAGRPGHGRGTGFPFEFEAEGTGEDDDTRDDDTRDDRPPRPGEIIQD